MRRCLKNKTAIISRIQEFFHIFCLCSISTEISVMSNVIMPLKNVDFSIFDSFFYMLALSEKINAFSVIWVSVKTKQSYMKSWKSTHMQ